MPNEPKIGPLTSDELLLVWRSSVDRGYSEPIELAGVGNGFEVYRQLFEQLARASTAIDVTTQAMYVRPWSGQSNEPAAGEARAEVDLAFARTLRLNEPLVLLAGSVFFEEQTTDAGENGPELFATGRRYTLQEDVVFFPGDAGPIVGAAIAEKPGWGYNNPLPGTIRLVDQPGTQFYNDRASVAVTAPAAYPAPPSPALQVTMVGFDAADMPVPEHVGQYFLMTAGANAGKAALAISFVRPRPELLIGSGVVLGQIVCFEAPSSAGAFLPGERVAFASPGGWGTIVAAREIAGTTRLRVAAAKLSGGIAAGSLVTGQVSGATCTVDSISFDRSWSVETAAASWRVLDWTLDWNLTVSNPASPAGGRLGFLDAIGKERNVRRAPNEPDDSYRPRVAEIADVVTPNAIRRALNRELPTTPWCFRETGLAEYPGWFFDHDAFDLDEVHLGGAPNTFADGEVVQQINAGVITRGRARVSYAAAASVPGPPGVKSFHGVAGVRGAFTTAQPVVGQTTGASFTPSSVAGGLRSQDRYRVVFGYAEMRAYFYVGIPASDGGDFGFAFDAHPRGAFDAGPLFFDFFDGAPIAAAAVRLRIFHAIDKIKAGGVGWELYEERGLCP